MHDTLMDGNRRIVERIVVTGELVLETPAHFGGDDALGFVDMALVRDPLSGDALLPGASIAGALRSYLRTRLRGYGVDEPQRSVKQDDELALLFGYQEAADGSQSSLLTVDARSRLPAIELRDGVAINPVTRTAEDKKKFNIELLPAGTIFDLRLELLVRASVSAAEGAQDEQAARMVAAFAQALQGFERGEIAMGARKRRGFGKCRVHTWQVRRYDLRQPAALLAWLSHDAHGAPTARGAGQSIAQLLGIADQAEPDRRACFTLTATFGLESSLLIRSGGDEAGQPDMVHLKSIRGGTSVPILSGTSLAGALRARALRIAKTVRSPAQAEKFVVDLFGSQERASRVWVAETEIENPVEQVVTRLKIDRFTGGAYPDALFSQQPVFASKDTQVAITFKVDHPGDADIGLILLLLKDLWTGDLAVGGEASVGRGRLCGKSADLELSYASNDPRVGHEQTTAPGTDKSAYSMRRWSLRDAAGGGLLLPDNADELQTFVDAFLNEVQHVEA
jgi:CRISPR/Cas system CSM-associated protein Csm3 (group 7 of RAMP superfamily)